MNKTLKEKHYFQGGEGVGKTIYRGKSLLSFPGF